MSSAIHPRNPESQNRRLTQFRRWHKWIGVSATLFLLVLGTTGIVLNYKQPIFTKAGIELRRGEREASPLPMRSPSREIKFTTGSAVSGGAVDFAGALAIARAEWGDVQLDRAELRSERGTVSYRFRKTGGEELWIDAADGMHVTKTEYERIGKPGADGLPTRQTDWGKLLIDLHTGRIGGDIGKAVVSFAAFLLLMLTLSGVYLWLKPMFIRCQKLGRKTLATVNSSEMRIHATSDRR